MTTLFILMQASSQEVMFSNSMKPYCRLCPVFQSRTISTLLTGPKREKMTSRSFSCVMGFSLQMKRMFSGGLRLASGRSPNISRVIACFLAFCCLVASIISLSFLHFCSISRCSTASSLSELRTGEGLRGGEGRAGGSGKGSSRRKVCSIRMFICGRQLLSTQVSLMRLSTSSPSSTFPKTVCLPAREAMLARVRVMKNSLLLRLGPELAVATSPISLILPSTSISSRKQGCACPHSFQTVVGWLVRTLVTQSAWGQAYSSVFLRTWRCCSA